MAKREQRGRIVLRFLAEPGDVNFGGKVHGGAVMKWIDQAGYTCAAIWTSSYCVTVYVGAIHFIQPIHVGAIVEMRAQVIHTGTTSVHIAVEAFAGDPKGAVLDRTCHCVIVFVAVGADGQPAGVPRWTPVTEEEEALDAFARRLIALRKELEAEISQSVLANHASKRAI